MLYEITGYRLPYSMVAQNNAVAVVAALMLGGGSIGLKNRNGSRFEMPVFTIPEYVPVWIKNTFGMDFNTLSKKVAAGYVGELESALKSIQLGMPGERNIPRPLPKYDLEAKAEKAADDIIKAIQKSLNRHNNTKH